MKALPLMLLLACAATGKASIRREAESRFEGCIGHAPTLRHVGRSPFLIRQCKAEVRQWCLDQGMEVDCGESP